MMGQSFTSCFCPILASAEMRKKLYGSILVIGGGYAFQSVATVLQAQLYIELPAIFQKPVDAIEVSSNPRVRNKFFITFEVSV